MFEVLSPTEFSFSKCQVYFVSLLVQILVVVALKSVAGFCAKMVVAGTSARFHEAF